MKRLFTSIFNITTATVLAAVMAAASSGFAQTTVGGGLLRNKAGRTLYVFDKDSAGESHCFDSCTNAWPPFLAADGAQPKERLTLVARKGGGMQWAFDGKPLYTFIGEAKPDDASGDGSGGNGYGSRTY